MTDEELKKSAFKKVIDFIYKMFPECQSMFNEQNGYGIGNFSYATNHYDWKRDYSCDPFRHPPEPSLELANKGGFEGDHDIVFDRLLEYTQFTPAGRCAVIFDIMSRYGSPSIDELPFICDYKKVGERLMEIDSIELFEAISYDSIFAFESGEVFMVDHDNRLLWAKRKYQK